MFTIDIAGMKIRVNNRFDLIREKCADYITEDTNNPDLVMEASPERIRHSLEWKMLVDHERITEEEGEFDAAPYTVYGQMTPFDAFWLHSVLLEADGVGYAFSAPPGYGKSTHARLWLKAFGDEVRVINGDNPVIRLQDGVFYGHGTPFCGKEGDQVNTRVPVAGVCFLKRAESNSIAPMSPALACAHMLRENTCIREQVAEDYIALCSRFLEKVPAFVLSCNTDISAAFTAREGLRRYTRG